MEINLKEIKVFENYQIDLVEAGHLKLSTEVVSSSLNYYGKAHGGYLFTLCDQVSGLVARSTGVDAVTLQANISYLKAGELGNRLSVEGVCIHDGKTTKIVEVSVFNESGALLTKGTFTMYVTGQR